MAEFVQKKVEDMRPVLEQMRKLKLFSEREICEITKKLKEYEYKLQRHTKSKEDFLRYIQYEMDLMKLVKQRRERYGITQMKSDIDFTIANKINHLYKDAILKFQDDLRFWIAYMKFCKHVKFHSCISRMIGRMLSIHQDKPKCWHIAALWEIEENNNQQNAKNFLLRGLHFHPDSKLLYTDIFKLELDYVFTKNNKVKSIDISTVRTIRNNSNIPVELQKVFIIYEQAFKRIRDIKFIIELLNITQGDMVKEYLHEPMMWDTMAHRELKGLIQPSLETDESSMEIQTLKHSSLRDRISNCYKVYQTAVKKIKTEEMWSLFIDCMLEINQETDTLPNFKRKLLKNVLLQCHQAKKLKEKYYLNWIDMLNFDKNNQNSNTQGKLFEILNWATEALPESESLWHAQLHYLLSTNQEELATEIFNKAIDILGKNSLPLFRLKLLHIQAKNPENLEKFFQDALKSEPIISNYIKPIYIEWIVLTKDIHIARRIYDKLCLHPPPCIELHKKMAALELLQPDISLQNARRPHEMTTLQFGKENTDVWMEFINFEMKYGEAIRVSNIYNRAVKTLKPKLADNFITEFSLIKANPELLGISL
ncbi:PREDICTED: U3 small nucleolar RNA-associated protein 6 homolog isoform X2 [Ceratosolen solmsi marchali]|uniref:U3 small nucleolar RNA-associated protein 6 homolog isoform X2 n=1 Tax=Ceratosolen solmsi marchali TaxID=326594 RepID=A0AAJ7DT50_9HYME|nr:PREDICTED: U3 small nucleolar RNA-associated protein 6 homolog isoform X2 [Ceratosolen solmsi marchali]